VRIVIALGGNAMTAPDGRARPSDQQAAVERAAQPIAEVVAAGHQVVVTHGNGPQVGNLLVKNELAASVVPPVPLDWCGAQTQATIGLLLLNALDRALGARACAARTAALVSRTRVDADDPGFARPTKPIGRYLPAAEATVMVEHGQQWQDRGSRGWRRVVASPQPLECLDAPAAARLLEAGFVVVCSGGGGVPVVLSSDGHGVHGVEAVIDKDLTAALLADTLDADLLIIATDVDHVMLGYGTAAARPVTATSPTELRALAGRGEFASGSMGPKVEAACRFAAQRSRRAVITSAEHIAEAVAGRVGTTVQARSTTDATGGPSPARSR
jgi:carbamate kinase